MRLLPCAAALGLGLLAATLAYAATPAGPDVKLHVQAERELLVPDGKGGTRTVMEDAPSASRGDVIVYTVNYVNAGGAPAVEPFIVDPFPAGTTYVLGSAGGPGVTVTFSIDGGKTYHAPPVTYVVTNPDGTTTTKDAPAEMYTHLRATVAGQLPASAAGKFTFKVTVN